MRILLIEDEVKTILSLRQGLEEHQWTVEIAYDGDTGRRLALKNEYDVIVSDIIVPGINGLELCRQLRREGLKTPIMLLSALGETDDKVSGLEAGADDYLTKPFEFREFLARVKALARRPTGTFQPDNMLRFADLELDQYARVVRRAGKTVSLTPREFALLEFFMRHPGRVLSKTEIAEKVWDVGFDTGTNVVEVYVNYLRNKVDKGFGQRLIHTLFGQGYVLKEEASE
ncbi:MAG: response regulator transcription factor [Saprospiraceae bacterium]|nr:response regulator transcription factor [Saprospiraceae bacterium]HNL38086.1 response regulator transcription factor [Saprospiraceae bacterium]